MLFLLHLCCFRVSLILLMFLVGCDWDYYYVSYFYFLFYFFSHQYFLVWCKLLCYLHFISHFRADVYCCLLFESICTYSSFQVIDCILFFSIISTTVLFNWVFILIICVSSLQISGFILIDNCCVISIRLSILISIKFLYPIVIYMFSFLDFLVISFFLMNSG